MRKDNFRDYLIFYDYPDTWRVQKGVYMIQHHYIGASKSVKQRIHGHIRNAYNAWPNVTELQRFIIDRIENYNCLEITYLSDNPLDEYYHYLRWRPQFNCPDENLFYHKKYGNKLDLSHLVNEVEYLKYY